MDFRLSFDCPFSKEELRKLIHCVLYEVLFVELINYDAYIKDWSDDRQISMTATYFSLNINLDEDEDEEYLERFRDMNLEAYGVDTNLLINIQFITRTFDIGWVKFVEIIGELLNVNDRDLVLEDDSTYPLLKRIKGSLLINSNLNEYRTWYMTKENLKLLNYPYKEEDF